MQLELRQLQQRLAITTVVVTHDQREAMTMADTIVVMKGGRILQVGRPIDVYRKPASPFVADFLGRTNALTATAEGPDVMIAGAKVPGLRLEGGRRKADVSVRPEDLILRPEGEAPLAATVSFVRDMGAAIDVFLTTKAGELVAQRAPGSAQLSIGDKVSVAIDPACVVVFAQGSAH